MNALTRRSGSGAREARPRSSPRRVRHKPLWQDLRGKTGYRVYGALILDELCRQTDLSTEALLRGLRHELRRPLSRQSLAAWRRGDQATPNDVLLAIHAVVRRTLSEVTLKVVMRVLRDPKSNPRFAEWLRFYYGRGRLELPAERPPWLAAAIGETRRRKRAAHSQVGPAPLWRDLQGKTRYRVFGALIFDELCNETDLNTEELRRRLRKELHRPLSRQSMAAWRRGDRSVPNDVLVATGVTVHRTLADASLVVVMRVLDDPLADPRFAQMLRVYDGHGRSGGDV